MPCVTSRLAFVRHDFANFRCRRFVVQSLALFWTFYEATKSMVARNAIRTLLFPLHRFRLLSHYLLLRSINISNPLTVLLHLLLYHCATLSDRFRMSTNATIVSIIQSLKHLVLTLPDMGANSAKSLPPAPTARRSRAGVGYEEGQDILPINLWSSGRPQTQDYQDRSGECP